ncbi:MAG: SUF system NifU family Fe-S cluster assembly protein [Ignavibacteria bacterium GWA2_55_11]|nr:MAG: SUF system NifU family Fe-S cluster assembly protein [Ignavibacteria bacterium GWA2_55_11]OGU44449.1 MAG: SUF system NifU family Fe-S cluster assembly protein [Ignavibacteria bacterium GWC2_56_12]HAV22370.1 SUF system NifU family Fe-S cluster assembly protein [Bacteroidota bacterium]
MTSGTESLYQDIILDHNRSPRNFRVLDGAHRIVEAYNPLCGDHYTIYLKLDGEIISDIAFQGSGCAISKSSASVMSTVVKGKTREEAEALFTAFHHLVTEGADAGEDLDQYGKLAAFSGVSEFPARVKCAILAWHTMKSALHSDAKTVSTE